MKLKGKVTGSPIHSQLIRNRKCMDLGLTSEMGSLQLSPLTYRIRTDIRKRVSELG